MTRLFRDLWELGKPTVAKVRGYALAGGFGLALACDVVIAWTRFAGRSRAAVRDTLGADDAMWARARGWALWKALITLDGPSTAAESRHVIEEVLADYAGAARS